MLLFLFPPPMALSPVVLAHVGDRNKNRLLRAIDLEQQLTGRKPNITRFTTDALIERFERIEALAKQQGIEIKPL